MRLRRDKRGDAVGRSGRELSLSGVPGAKFFCEKPGIGTKMKNSLNFVSTCLKVVDTRRRSQNLALSCTETVGLLIN